MALDKIFSVIETRGEERVVEIPNMGRVGGKFYRGYYAVIINGKKYIFNGTELISLDGKVIDPTMKMEILYDYPVEKLLSDFRDVVGPLAQRAVSNKKQQEKMPHPLVSVTLSFLMIITVYYLFVNREIGYALGFISSLGALAADVYYRRGWASIAFALIGAVLFGLYLLQSFL